MRVAIIHYHLRTGGVSRIIAHTAEELSARGVDVVVLSGEPPEGRWPADVRVVDGLGYDGVRHACEPGVLALDLQRAAWEALGDAPDLWHVHNHSLGKNLALPGALWRLAQEGQPLLLHIHDFPEDGRPANYRRMLDAIGDGDVARLSHYLYPQAPQVHYGVLNGRDRDALQAGGCPWDRTHVLPNPVSLEAAPPGEPGLRLGDRRLWLYPTRAIRRKNLGEFLLWSALAEEEDRFATTRAPENPAELPVYENWVGFAERHGLDVEFGIGEHWGGSFESLLGAAHAAVTTSVAEGFGMAFLEPWLAGRPVCGRDLPEITREFAGEGVDLAGLYARLEIPASWPGEDILAERARSGLERLYEAYGQPLTDGHLIRCLDAWIHDGRVDFGRLDEGLQQAVIERLLDSSAARSEMEPEQLAPAAGDTSPSVAFNAERIREGFSVARYGERLMDLYADMTDCESALPDALSGDRILQQFLAPERLTLLRS